MDLGIHGRRALVCGASKGLGFACALALAREGVATTIVARDRNSIEVAAERVRSATGKPCPAVAADLSTIAGREWALTACPAADIMITNGGGPPSKDFTVLSLEDWQQALRAC
jgi:3-oxoacyl-[acyl-carrier protein] reductase